METSAAHEDEKHKVYMTVATLTMMGAALLAFSIVIILGWLAHWFDLIPAVMMLALDIPVGLSWWLARRGRWQFGSYVAPALMFALGLYGSYFVGLATSFVLFYALAILLASMLRGGQAPWLVLVLCVLTHLAVGGFRDVQYRAEWVSIAITLTGAFVGIALLQWFSARQVERALSQARAELGERRRAEKALLESQMLFRSLLESLPLNVYSKDVQGRFIFANRCYCETHGKTREEIVGKTDAELHPPELALKYLKDDRRVMETGQTVEIEEQHQPIGQSPFYVQVIKTPLHDMLGRITGTLGIFWDITERKRAGEERARLTAILESTSDLVSTSTPEAKLTYLNAAGRRMAGWSDDEEVTGHVIADLHPTWALEIIEKTGIPATLEKGVWQGETAILRRDGSEIPVSQVILAHRSASGELQYLSTIMRDITERKQAEETLRESESMYRRAIEIAGAVPYYQEYEPETYPFMGEGIRQLTGYSPEDMTPALWRSLVLDLTLLGEAAGLDRQEAARRARAGDFNVWQCDMRIQARDGQVRWVSDAAVEIKDEQGRRVGSIGILQDITERKQTEQALRESEARYRQLFESESDAIFLVENETGRILEANTAAAALYGYRREELLGMRNTDLSAEPDETRQAVAEQKGLVPIRFHRKRDGAVFPVEITGSHFTWRGRPAHIAAIRDITERRQSEESLRRYADENAGLLQAERQHRAMAETLREVGATLAATLNADIVLDRLLEQVGRVVPHDVANVMIIEGDQVRIVRSRGYQALGIDISAAYAPHPFADVPNLVQMAETGEPLVVADVVADPGWVRRSELSWRRSYAGVPIRARGKAIGFINVSHSMPGYYTFEHAERLRAFADQAAIALENARLFAAEQQRAAELARALDQQRELDRLQREFIQNVSHELRTPLALIRGHAEVLDSGWLGELPPEQKESMGVIVRRSQMLGKLVEDIMAILATERRELKRESVDLSALVSTTVADFQPNAAKADLTLTASVAPDLVILGDPLALRRVLDNLIGNAFKFTPAGGRVTARLYQDNDTLVLQVADSGVGISSDKLGRIFERFYQVNGSATRKYGGVGLGLSLVKEIVEAHGGQISAASQVGAGTTFTILLPVGRG